MYLDNLATMVSEKTGIEKKRVLDVLHTAIEITEIELANGGDVRIRNFGTFYVSKMNERKGRNPQTGEEIIIPAHKVPKFKPESVDKQPPVMGGCCELILFYKSLIKGEVKNDKDNSEKPSDKKSSAQRN